MITTTLYINGVEAFHDIHYNLQSVAAENVKQVHRTGFHFQPKQNWINGTNPFLSLFLSQFLLMTAGIKFLFLFHKYV